jgi:hypothetical protein
MQHNMGSMFQVVERRRTGRGERLSLPPSGSFVIHVTTCILVASLKPLEPFNSGYCCIQGFFQSVQHGVRRWWRFGCRKSAAEIVRLNVKFLALLALLALFTGTRRSFGK